MEKFETYAVNQAQKAVKKLKDANDYLEKEDAEFRIGFEVRIMKKKEEVNEKKIQTQSE
jgi:hypothetical protein